MGFENSFGNPGGPELAPESQEPAVEKEKLPELNFYVTDHSADNPDTGTPEKLRELYADIRRDGVQSVRYDWRWQRIEPHAGEYNGAQLKRYARAREIMGEVGLKEPTIILSSFPQWAKELYRENKEQFFEAYQRYAEQVRDSLHGVAGEKVSRVQILNELNNPVYTPVDVEDLPRLCQITREVFHSYNPEIKLMGTLVAGNLPEYAARVGFGKPLGEYLSAFEEIKDSFDVVAIDYYPGLWHLPLREANWNMKDVFKQLGLLREVFERIAAWGKEYELGEMGFPTNRPWSSERRQRYFYDVFFRAFRRLVADFRARGVRLPSGIGLYEAVDAPPQTTRGKLLRKTPFPEHDMGMRLGSGKRKLILQGSPHVPEEERIKKPSQLQKIISYLRRPIKESE